MRKNLHKKGQTFNMMSQLAIGVAGLAIILVVTFLIMSQAKTNIGTIEGITDVTNSTQCQASIACNSTSTLQTAVDIIPDFVSIVIIAGIGAALIGIVALFARRR